MDPRGPRRLSTRTNQHSRGGSSDLGDVFVFDPDGDAEPRAASPETSILDVVRRGKEPPGVLVGSGSDGAPHHINWKVLRERLRLRRASAAFASSVPRRPAPSRIPSLRPGSPRPSAVLRPTLSSARSMRNPALSKSDTSVMRLGFEWNSEQIHANQHEVNKEERKDRGVEDRGAEDRRAEDRGTENRRVEDRRDEKRAAVVEKEEEDGGEVIYPWQRPKPQAEATTMSLMALLEQSDMMDDDDEEGYGDEGLEEDEEEEEAEELESECCICMVKHKGAGFKTCGHTFCRLCSRELWVESGTCPLCDGFVIEILHTC